jgi:hypothetical protein
MFSENIPYGYISKTDHLRKELIMNKRLRLCGIICVFFLLALSLSGCDNPPWEAGMTLILKVDAPKDGTTVNTSTITVNGRVSGTEAAGASIKVNEMDAPVKEGKYSADITLTEGKNIITISAKGGQANMNEQRTVTYVPAKK